MELYQVIFEISFSVIYLVILCFVICLMIHNKSKLHYSNKTLAKLFILSFILLLLGDSIHLGTRIFSYINGGLYEHSYLIGIGTFITSITLSLFYMCFTDIWRIRYIKPHNTLWCFLMLCGIFRILLMLNPLNQWFSSTPPLDWYLARNVLLIIQGVGVGIAILFNAYSYNDTLFKQLSSLILISFVLFIPVVFFVHMNPLFALFIIPKTVCYILIAFTSYSLFKSN